MSEPTFYTHTPMYYQEGTVTDHGIVQKIEYINNGVYAVYCKSAQQSVHLTGGILPHLRDLFLRKYFPAPKQNPKSPTRK